MPETLPAQSPFTVLTHISAAPMMLLEIGNGEGVDVDYHRAWKYSLALHLYKACILRLSLE